MFLTTSKHANIDSLDLIKTRNKKESQDTLTLSRFCDIMISLFWFNNFYNPFSKNDGFPVCVMEKPSFFLIQYVFIWSAFCLPSLMDLIADLQVFSIPVIICCFSPSHLFWRWFATTLTAFSGRLHWFLFYQPSTWAFGFQFRKSPYKYHVFTHSLKYSILQPD